MIGPVSILSLAAVSAAESTSSGRRGLREPADWKLPAIVLGATVTFCLGGGILIGKYLIGGNSSSEGYDLPATSTDYEKRVVGCDNTHFQKNDDPAEKDTAPDCAGVCQKNTRNPNKFTPFGKKEQKDVCTVCKADHYWKGDTNGCVACTDAHADTFTLPGKLEAASGAETTAENIKKICLPVCGKTADAVDGLTAGTSCLCGPSTLTLTKDNTVQCTQGTHKTCKETKDKKGECA